VKNLRGLVLSVGMALMCCGTMFSQTGGDDAALPNAPEPQVASSEDVTVRGLPLAVLKDQGKIWTSPARIRTKDLIWLAPLAAATGVGIATDHRAMSSVVSHDVGFNNANVNASNVLIGGLIAAPAALFGVGHFEHNEKARETGLLGAEALVDAVVVEQGMKLVFWRERPAMDNSRGLFFQSVSGINSSFPSSHAVVAWSSAAVIAEEYRSPWVQVGVYSLATGVSLTRVLGQQHFPTDVLVGSAAGWLVGHYVAKARHRHEARQ
jgi:membrane-associated phospholipid phosphatase